MRVGPREVEIDLIILTPQRTGDLVRTHTQTVVINVIFEVGLLLRNHDLQDLGHGALVAFEHFLHRGNEVVDPEPVAHFVHAPLGKAQRGDNPVEVSLVPLRHPAVAQDDVEHFLVQFALAVDLDGWDLHPLFEDLRGIRRQ